MSVGRNLAKTLIDTASDLRRYASLLDEFDDFAAATLGAEMLLNARRIESLVTPTLSFEGENLPLLTAGETVTA